MTTPSTAPDKRLGRRRWLRWAGAAAGGLLFARAGWGLRRTTLVSDRTSPAAKVDILPACVGCTGCVSACPTDALRVVAGGIAADAAKCIRCGHCVAACPVGGIRVNRED